MLIERVYSTHNTAHEGGNKCHAADEIGGHPLCGSTSSFFFSAAGGARVERVEDLHLYVDCLRCQRILEKRFC
jgi:hypothetical protein